MKPITMAKSLVQNPKRDFWSEAKRINGPSSSQPSVMDDCHDDPDICYIYSKKIMKAYTTVCPMVMMI